MTTLQCNTGVAVTAHSYGCEWTFVMLRLTHFFDLMSLWLLVIFCSCHIVGVLFPDITFPISRITPFESHHPPPDIHTWPLLTPLWSESSDSPQAKKHSISSLAFHLKNKVVLLISGQGLFLSSVLPPWSSFYLSGAAAAGHSWPHREERLSFIPAPLKAIMFRHLYGQIMFLAEMADELHPVSFFITACHN